MARSSGSLEVQKFIPSMEKNADKPSVVYFIPLTKEKYDKYLNSLAEFKKNKFISHADTAFSKLCELSLAADSNGIILENFYWTQDGKTNLLETVKDKALAIKVLCGLQDIDCANEIETKMKGQATLSEEEEKN